MRGLVGGTLRARGVVESRGSTDRRTVCTSNRNKGRSPRGSYKDLLNLQRLSRRGDGPQETTDCQVLRGGQPEPTVVGGGGRVRPVRIGLAPGRDVRRTLAGAPTEKEDTTTEDLSRRPVDRSPL